MPDLSKLSDQELKQRYLRSLSDDELRKRAGVSEPPAADQPEPSTMSDIARSAGRGVAKGVIGMAGFAGDVAALASNYNPLDWLAEKYRTAYPEQAAKNVALAEKVGHVSEIGRGYPTSAAITRKVESVAGPMGTPETEAGRYAESIGEFVPSALMQPGGPLTKAVTTLGAGIGAQAGEELGGPTGRFIGGLVGGSVGGTGAQSVTAARARRALPTSEANRAASKAAFDQISQAGLVIEPSEVQNFATGLRADLDRDLFSRDPAGRGSVGYQAADQIERAQGDLATIMNVHGALGRVNPGEGANYAAAMLTRDAVREWIGNLQPNQVVRGDPQFVDTLWQQARDTWRVHSNLEEIYGALQSAEWRRAVSGRGTNLNTLRQNIRRILDNDNLVRRYSPEARQAMQDVVEGDLARNTMRKIAAFAPHGPVSSIPVALSAVTGHADFGSAVAAGGFIAHFFQGRMEQRSLNALLDIIREGSPLTNQRARNLLARSRQPIAGIAAARGGALAAGAGSPLADQPPPE